jgi:DNA polymerase (family X)
VPKLDALEVAELLVEYGRRKMLLGGNPYRAKAYIRAAENLALLTEPLGAVIADGRLRQVPSVGEAIADIITKLHQTGGHPSLEKIRQDFPASLLELLTVPGLPREKIVKLHKDLGINTLEELETAVRQDRLKGVKGLGPALQRKILAGLEIRQTAKNARHIHRAADLLDAAQVNLKRSLEDAKRITIAGDLRRGSELVSDLALVAEVPALEEPQEVKSGELTVHLTDEKHFGAGLLFATGSEAHLDALCALAKRKGLTLNAEGLKRDGRVVASRSEREIYEALGLAFIEPELREGGDEIALAKSKRLPKLVKDEDICGVLHAHTDASDGANTLQQMAEATRKRGYAYLGITDHSRSAHYAGGLNVDEISEQHEAIERLNASYGDDFRIFKGIESDILPDGSLDYPDDVLRQLDFVVASVHGQFRKDISAQTERIIKAVANPHTTILGHMTGRQLLRRPGYEVDVERVLAACAKHDVAVEINSNPWRLDLDWRWHRRALELGCTFSINPDAHSTAEIDLTHWGVVMARKGGISPDRVLNCLDLQAFDRYLASRKEANELDSI